MKILAFDFNNILDDVMRELVNRGHELINHRDKWKEADVVVVWQETDLGGAKDWVHKVQKGGKRVVLMQHGRRGTSRIFPPFNEELVSDQLCVWGLNDVKRMVKCGVPREKIHVTGTPVLGHIKPRRPHKGINVVFSPEHWDMEVAENFAVRDALRKFVKSRWPWQKKIRIITKTLQNEHAPYNYDNPVESNRMNPGHLDIAIDVLRDADAVVAVSESTFELLAQTMGIPVIIADIWQPKSCAGDERYKEYEREYSPACEKVQDLNKLGEVIMKHIKNPNLLAEERKEIARLDGGIDIVDPIESIIKVITTNEKTRRRNSPRGSRPRKRRNTK
jgi:hypothetical protein